MNDQGGQAMAEFAIALAVLSVLLLAMPVIGRYHELQIATIEGARQLAFRHSWHLDGRSSADEGSLRAALFPPARSDGQPDVGSLNASFGVGAAPGHAGRAAQMWLAPFRLVATSSFDLRDRALHSAELKVTVTSPAGLPDPFAGSQPEFVSRYELLGDEWASSGPAQVADRTSGLLVTRPAGVLRPLLSFGKELLALVEPSFRDLCLGLVDPEQVPSDRLGAASEDGSTPTGWRPRC